MPKRTGEAPTEEDLRTSKRNKEFEDVPSTPHGHLYSSIQLYGNAKAIFGDVQGAGDVFNRRTTENERKRLVLRSLHFQDMRARRDHVDSRAGSPNSIQWIWATDFGSWLENGQSFFWITGAPGSGKSTLMKHISESKRTRAHLSSDGSHWLVVHFYFDFRAGKNIANSLEGLVRSLLFQLVQNVPDLVDVIDNDVVSNTDANIGVAQYVDHLCDALRSTDRRVCAFIDGLDEFHGSTTDLFDLIDKLEDRGNLKICLASRSLPSLQQHLIRCRHLTVNHHNNGSIRNFAEATLAESMILAATSELSIMATRVVQKANGNFLWARLVIDELLVALEDGQPISKVLDVLDSLPKEVQSMYETILSRIPSFLKQEAAVLIHLILQAEGSIGLRRLYAGYANMLGRGILETDNIPVDVDGALEKRILAMLGGLVDVSQSGRSTVAYVNRQILCCQYQHVRVKLTHESLSSFLPGCEWVQSHLPKAVLSVYSTQAWLRLQIEEILTCSQLAEDPLSKVAGAFDRLLLILSRSEAEGLSTYERRRTALLDFLHVWPSWTPFLPYAVENIFVAVRTSPHIPQELEALFQAAMRSSAMYLHCALCLFHNYVGAHSSSYAYESCGDIVRRPRLYAVTKASKKHDLSLCLAVCHGIPNAVDFDTSIRVLDSEARQSLFSVFFIKGISSSLHQDFESFLTRLADSGGQLNERHLCRFLVTNDPSRPPMYFDLLEKYLSPAALRDHADRCPAYTKDEARRVSFWHHLASWWSPDGMIGLSQATRLVKLFLSRDLEILATQFEKPDNIMHDMLAWRLGNFFPRNRMTKLIACIQGGGDLQSKGQYGTVYDYADLYYKKMKEDPQHRNAWTDYDGVEDRLTEAKMIKELLEHHRKHGALPENLEYYVSFSCP